MTSSVARSVHHRYYVNAAAARLSRAISEPAELTRWLCDDAEISLEKGGRYRLGWRHGPTHTGTVLTVRPGREYTLSWAWDGVALEGTTLRLASSPKGRGALLEIEHRGFPRAERWTELLAGAEWGWTYFAMNLKSVLETGHDLRSSSDG